jgi:hypothetical protein
MLDDARPSLNMTRPSRQVLPFVDLYARGIGGQIRLTGQSIGPTGP